MWSNRNSHSLLVGMQKYSHFQGSLPISHKAKHHPTKQSSNHSYQMGLKIYGHTKNWHMTFYRSFIHSYKKMKTNKLSLSKLLCKQAMVHRFNEILISNWKKKWIIDKTMQRHEWILNTHYKVKKKIIWKAYILYTVWF